MKRTLLFLILMTLIACHLPEKDKPDCKRPCKGVVLEKSYDSKILGRNINYNVYLPVDFPNKKSELPILYLLHGHGGNEDDWFELKEGHVANILDSLYLNQDIPQLIAVSMDAGNSWYVDSKEKMETAYINEFIPLVESQFFAIPARKRMIVGNSAGGYGALRMAMKYPDMFHTALLLSPAAYLPTPPPHSSSRSVDAFERNDTFNDSIWQSYSYIHLIDDLKNATNKPLFYLTAGDDDNYNIVPVVTEIQQLLNSNEIKNELRITDGHHDWVCWKSHFSLALKDLHKQNHIDRKIK